MARVQMRGVSYQLRGPDPDKLAVLRDRVARYLGANEWQLNFPQRALRPMALEQARLHLKVERKKAASSRYFGVSLGSDGRWQAVVRLQSGKRTTLGAWPTEKAAAVAYDRALIHEFGSGVAHLNFPARREILDPASPDTLRREARGRFKRSTSSKYFGVYLINAMPAQPWAASITNDGDERFLGSWESERDAALAYDRASLHYRGSGATLNFPTRAASLGAANAASLRAEAHTSKKQRMTSQYRGVSWYADGWHARIQQDSKSVRLGRFKEEDAAARAYDAAARSLHGKKAKLNFP
jgi:hypothetical protein